MFFKPDSFLKFVTTFFPLLNKYTCIAVSLFFYLIFFLQLHSSITDTQQFYVFNSVSFGKQLRPLDTVQSQCRPVLSSPRHLLVLSSLTLQLPFLRHHYLEFHIENHCLEFGSYSVQLHACLLSHSIILLNLIYVVACSRSSFLLLRLLYGDVEILISEFVLIL